MNCFELRASGQLPTPDRGSEPPQPRPAQLGAVQLLSGCPTRSSPAGTWVPWPLPLHSLHGPRELLLWFLWSWGQAPRAGHPGLQAVAPGQQGPGLRLVRPPGRGTEMPITASPGSSLPVVAWAGIGPQTQAEPGRVPGTLSWGEQPKLGVRQPWRETVERSKARLISQGFLWIFPKNCLHIFKRLKIPLNPSVPDCAKTPSECSFCTPMLFCFTSIFPGAWHTGGANKMK